MHQTSCCSAQLAAAAAFLIVAVPCQSQIEHSQWFLVDQDKVSWEVPEVGRLKPVQPRAWLASRMGYASCTGEQAGRSS